MKQAYLVAVVAAFSAHPAAAADPLCGVVKRFASAPFREKRDILQGRRWIEFHWGFGHSPGDVWSWGCRHSDEAIAGQTCAWLRDHSNQELTMALPQGVMTCYGYRFPRHAVYDWAGVAGTITLPGKQGRRLILDLQYRDLPRGEAAMRLAVEADDAGREPDKLPPIVPMAEN